MQQTPGKNSRLKSLRWAIAATALIALALIFFLTRDASGKKKSDVEQLSARLTEVQQVMSTVTALHQEFGSLQRMDEEYNVLAFNEGSPQSLDRLNRSIKQKEVSLQQMITNVQLKTPEFKAWANVLLLDSVTKMFT